MNFLDSLSVNYKGFDVKLRGITIGETYDDNVTFSKENPKEDFITNAGLGVSVKYEGKITSLEVIGSLYSETFAKNDNLNNVSQDVTLNFKTEFSEYERMSLKNTFAHTYVPLWFEGAQFFVDQFGRTEGRFSYYKNKFSIDYSRDITEHFALLAKYGNDVDAFSTESLSDSFLNRFGFETDYLLNPDTTLYFAYDFSDRDFEDADNALINTITFGTRQSITKKLYFDAGIGLDFIDAFDDVELVRPLAQASLAYEISETTRARLVFIKKYDTSPYNVDIFNYWRTSAFFTRQLSERFGSSVSLFYGNGDYISSGFEQRLIGATPAITYDINKNLKGNLTYTYSFSDSDVETAGYTKNTVFFGLAAEF
ncbi:MAG: outer membrane beta-barrel protein [Planctomycetes bacterium]|nr:outer membrane beta-barrel protein [Planctomycetota bacterium]